MIRSRPGHGTTATESATNHPAQHVIPDGYPELIFSLGDAFQHRAAHATTFEDQPAVILNGQIREAVNIRPTGQVWLIGIRLQPWALGALLRSPAAELTDQWGPLDAIAPRLLPDLLDALRASNASASDEECFAHCFETTMAHFRAATARLPLPDLRIVGAVRLAMTAMPEGITTPLHRHVGMSDRTLQRRLRDEVGLGATTLAKLARLQRALALRQAQSALTWASAAASAGYYDQSHFNRDFREVAGCAPGEFLAEPASMTAKFISNGESSDRLY